MWWDLGCAESKERPSTVFPVALFRHWSSVSVRRKVKHKGKAVTCNPHTHGSSLSSVQQSQTEGKPSEQQNESNSLKGAVQVHILSVFNQYKSRNKSEIGEVSKKKKNRKVNIYFTPLHIQMWDYCRCVLLNNREEKDVSACLSVVASISTMPIASVCSKSIGSRLQLSRCVKWIGCDSILTLMLCGR